MAKYRKALVAAAGILVLFVPEAAGLGDNVGLVFDGVVGALTAFGVFQVKNEPSD